MKSMRKSVRKILIWIPALLMLSIVMPGIRAQVEVRPETDELLMGNRMKLAVSIPLESDSSKVEIPMLQQAKAAGKKYVGLLNDTIDLLTSYSRSLQNADGKPFMRYELTIQAFDSGSYQLPPIEFIVDGKPVMTSPVAINVIPVKVKADDPIEGFSDIAEPFEVNPNPEELEQDEAGGLIIWLVALAVLLAAVIIYLYLRYRKTGSLLSFAKPQPPYAKALSRLKKLKSQNLPAKGKTKEYYTRLTDIIRQYLNRQFGVKTMEKTTREILGQVHLNDELEKYEPLLTSLFETADFVKFAKVNPQEAENERCMAEAVRFIKASRPAEEEKKGGKK